MSILKHLDINGVTYDLGSGHVFFGTLKYYAHDSSRNYNPTIQIDTVNHDFDFQKGSILKLAFLYYSNPGAEPSLNENYTLSINNDSTVNTFIIDGVTFTNDISLKSIRLIKIGYNQTASDNNVTFKRGQIIDYIYMPDFQYAGGTAIPTLIADRSLADLTMKVTFGTCNTISSTAEKAVTCSDFNLDKNSIIGIFFSEANTTATPTLNINSTGAITIYKGISAINGTTNSLKWSAYTILYFLYDGTYYRYIISMAADENVRPEGAGCWYGSSSSSATTGTKTSSIANYSLVPGSIVNVTFTYANTYTSAALTLNINGTGAKTIYYNGSATSSSNTLLWDANETLTFVYSGTYYYYVGKSGDTKEIKTINNNIGTISSLTTPSTTNLVNAINSINILDLGQTIPSGSDLDDYYTPGIYYFSSSAYNNLSNYPGEICYSYDGEGYEDLPSLKLIVSQQTPYVCKQELCAYSSNDYMGYYSNMFFRFGDLTGQGSWGPWHKVLTTIENYDNDNVSLLTSKIPLFTQNPSSSTLDLGFRNLKIRRGNQGTNNNSLTSIQTCDDRLTLGSTHDISSDSIGGFYGRDSNNKIVGSFTFGVSSSGSGYAYMGARNANTNVNRMTLFKDNDGTDRVSVSAPAAWRSALGLGSVLSAITNLQNGLVVQSFSGTRQSTLSSGTCQGIYIPLLDLVIIEFHFTASSTVGTSTNLYTIASKYRPSSGKNGSGYGKSSTATGGLTISINTSGQIRQGTMTACAGGFGILVYTI